jgi:hypothetical protein
MRLEPLGAQIETLLLITSFPFPSLRPHRRIRQLVAIERDLLRRIETEHAAAACGIGLRVVFGIGEGVAFHGHAGAVAEEDGLAVGFVVGAG